MSSDRDPPLPAERSQQPRRGSGYFTSTPEAAFRRPALRGTSEQHSQKATRPRHTEPFRSGLGPNRPTYADPKSRYSGLSFKSTTSTPTLSASKSITQSQWRDPSAHSPELGKVSAHYIWHFSFVLKTDFSTIEPKMPDLHFRHQQKHPTPQVYQVDHFS